jgi:hypothetical protein
VAGGFATAGAGKVAVIAGKAVGGSVIGAGRTLAPVAARMSETYLSRIGAMAYAVEPGIPAAEAKGVETAAAGAAETAAQGRTAELQAKWGDLSATERRTLLESKSETTWSSWLTQRDAQAKAVNPNAHFMQKHGAGTNLGAQKIRATTRTAPDGSIDVAHRDSTRFLSARDMGAAMQRVDSIFTLNGKINKSYSFSMESVIGEGYTKAPNSNWMLTTNVSAVYRNGQPYTMFPLLRSVP